MASVVKKELFVRGFVCWRVLDAALKRGVCSLGMFLLKFNYHIYINKIKVWITHK